MDRNVFLLTFWSKVSFSSVLPLSSFGFPYHLSTSGWMNLCQIYRNTGTRIHDIHTIFIWTKSFFCLGRKSLWFRCKIFKDSSDESWYACPKQDIKVFIFYVHCNAGSVMEASLVRPTGDFVNWEIISCIYENWLNVSVITNPYVCWIFYFI